MDNMEHFETSVNRMNHQPPQSVMTEAFENRVFYKIKRKKQQRKLVATAVLGMVVFGFVVVAGRTFFQNRPTPDSLTEVHSLANDTREEIPVNEDVVFASSDARTNYAIEQVVYRNENESI